MHGIHILIIFLICLAIYLVIRYTYLWRFTHFVCPKCQHKFKPTVGGLVFSTNALLGKILKCPKCGEKAYMEPVRDSKNRN